MVKDSVKNYKMPFGKFKDKPLEEVPLKYLDWLMGETDLKTHTPMTYKVVSEYLEDPVIKKDLERQLDE